MRLWTAEHCGSYSVACDNQSVCIRQYAIVDSRRICLPNYICKTIIFLDGYFPKIYQYHFYALCIKLSRIRRFNCFYSTVSVFVFLFSVGDRTIRSLSLESSGKMFCFRLERTVSHTFLKYLLDATRIGTIGTTLHQVTW